MSLYSAGKVNGWSLRAWFPARNMQMIVWGCLAFDSVGNLLKNECKLNQHGYHSSDMAYHLVCI